MSFGAFICEMEQRTQWATRRLREDRTNRSAARVLLAAQLGLYDVDRVPDCMIRANGRHNSRHIDQPPASRAHNCSEIPAYSEIATVVDDLADIGNTARRLQAYGVIVEDKAPARLNGRARGIMRAIWLFHLWQGHDVGQLRPRWYHPEDVKWYWPLAWEMSGDGTRHADALAYLSALCVRWSQHRGRVHAGQGFHRAALSLLIAETER